MLVRTSESIRTLAIASFLVPPLNSKFALAVPKACANFGSAALGVLAHARPKHGAMLAFSPPLGGKFYARARRLAPPLRFRRKPRDRALAHNAEPRRRHLS